MYFIPNIIPSFEDELLYSWISRLAAVNGLSLQIFVATYIFPNIKKEVTNYDYYENNERNNLKDKNEKLKTNKEKLVEENKKLKKIIDNRH